MNKVKLFLILAILFSSILFFIDYYLGIDHKDVVVEAHGLVMDVILFGIVITLYESKTSKKEKIRDLEEQLDDFRQWEQTEATYRIIGILKRLKKLNLSKIDLSYCYLKNAYFDSKFDMKGVLFSHARMQHCRLNEVNFSNCEMFGTNLELAFLAHVNFCNTNLEAACLNNARMLRNVNLSNANLKRAGLINLNFGENINMTNVDLSDALVDKSFFDQLEKSEVIGREKIISSYKIVRRGNEEKNLFQLEKLNVSTKRPVHNNI